MRGWSPTAPVERRRLLLNWLAQDCLRTNRRKERFGSGMQTMEASFRSRVEQAFGALTGSSEHGAPAPLVASASASGAANSWSVSEVAIACNQGSKVAEESSGSESDEPCAARYEKFVKLAKRARRRQRDDDEVGFGKEIDLDDLDDLDEEGRPTKRRRGDGPEERLSAGHEDLDEEEECREVRLMVGMDDTLDFEEEEDEYDKVAVGREGAGERVYMREVTGVSSDLSPLTPLPDSVPGSERRKFRRDSRANHAAAVARLEEDDRLATIKNSEVARMLVSSASSREPSGNGACSNIFPHAGGSSSPKTIKPALMRSEDLEGKGKTDTQSKELSKVAAEEGIANGDAHQKESCKDSAGQDGNTNSVTKHTENGSRLEGKTKRVRFAEDDHVIMEKDKESVSGRAIQKVREISSSKNRYGRVPDHVRNPSKYTHYTLEWSDEEDDNKANVAAFQAMQAVARAAEEKEDPGTVELPKFITFTPRSGGATNKSNGEAKISTGTGFQQSQVLVSFSEEVLTQSIPQPEDVSLSSTAISPSAEAKTARVFRKRAREEDRDDTTAKREGL